MFFFLFCVVLGMNESWRKLLYNLFLMKTTMLLTKCILYKGVLLGYLRYKGLIVIVVRLVGWLCCYVVFHSRFQFWLWFDIILTTVIDLQF